MMKKGKLELGPRMKQAISELEALVRQRYPDATFQVTRHPEDSEAVLLKAEVDVEDRDEVMDVVIDRMVEMQSDEDLPVFVVPTRPKARNEAIRRALDEAAPAWRKHRWLDPDEDE